MWKAAIRFGFLLQFFLLMTSLYTPDPQLSQRVTGTGRSTSTVRNLSNTLTPPQVVALLFHRKQM